MKAPRVKVPRISDKGMAWLMGSATVGLLILWAAAWWLGWLESVKFVSHLSIAALVLTTLVGWDNARDDDAGAANKQE
jgi:hypothetical protein